jgi:hypothetical protein
MKSLDVAWLGFKNEHFIKTLGWTALSSPTSLGLDFCSIIDFHKDLDLSLFIIKIFIENPVLLHDLGKHSAHGLRTVKRITDALQLTERLNLPDPNDPSFLWNTAVVEGIFNQMVDLLEAAIEQENQENVMPRSVMR